MGHLILNAVGMILQKTSTEAEITIVGNQRENVVAEKDQIFPCLTVSEDLHHPKTDIVLFTLGDRKKEVLGNHVGTLKILGMLV